MCKRLWVSLLGLLAVGLLVGCGSTGSGGGTQYNAVSAQRGKAPGGGNSAAEKLRAAQIAAEPRGSYYVGRRFYIKGTRFWGYLRKPGEPWQQARLVVMNESSKLQPDRLPERPVGAESRYSFDHNHEYKLWGRFSGNTVYDPNSNLFLPEFVLSNYELISANPGWLFTPQETFSEGKLPWVPGR